VEFWASGKKRAVEYLIEMGELEDTKGVIAVPRTVKAVAEPAVGAFLDKET